MKFQIFQSFKFFCKFTKVDGTFLSIYASHELSNEMKYEQKTCLILEQCCRLGELQARFRSSYYLLHIS